MAKTSLIFKNYGGLKNEFTTTKQSFKQIEQFS